MNGFDESETPEWYNETNEPFPEAGRDKGLTLVVDGHSNKLSRATVSDNFRGFITVVDDKDKFPLVSLSSLIARPGYENEIKVSAIHLKGLEDIRTYSPEKRKCYFPDEYKLEMHEYYSHHNCIFECETEFAAECLKTCNEFDQTCDCSKVSTSSRTLTNEISTFSLTVLA